jgi:hypothetical protein
MNSPRREKGWRGLLQKDALDLGAPNWGAEVLNPHWRSHGAVVEAKLSVAKMDPGSGNLEEVKEGDERNVKKFDIS